MSASHTPQASPLSNVLCISRVETFLQDHEFETCVQEILASPLKEQLPANLQRLFKHWVQITWQAALDYLFTLEAKYRDHLADNLIKAAARIDFDGVLLWLEVQDFDHNQRQDFNTSAFLTLAEKDPQDAIANTALLTDADIKTYVIDSLLEYWGTQDINAALAWLDQQTHPEFYV